MPINNEKIVPAIGRTVQRSMYTDLDDAYNRLMDDLIKAEYNRPNMVLSSILYVMDKLIELYGDLSPDKTCLFHYMSEVMTSNTTLPKEE